MVITVHAGEKPAAPHRAWLASILLILAVSALAAALTWQRAQEREAPTIQPPGWSISFRPPHRFMVGEPGLTSFGQAYPMLGPTSRNVLAAMVVYRLEDAFTNQLATLCERLVLASLPPTGTEPVIGMSCFTWFDRELGGRRAVEVWDPVFEVLVRAADLGNGEVYAVTLSVQGPEIDPDTYLTFDQTCLSILPRFD